MLIHKGLIIMVIIGNNNNCYQGNRFMLPREMIHIQQVSVWKYRQNFYQTLWLLLFTHSKKISDIVCNGNHTKIWKHCLEQRKRIKTMWENWSQSEIVLPIYTANAIHSPQSSGNVTWFLRNSQLRERVLELGI